MRIGDPWMLLTAAALATSRIELGPMVTPVPRRRPQQLARQVSTLDNLSGGRVIFGAGLGGPIEDEYGSFGEPTEPGRAGRAAWTKVWNCCDRYWSGEPVNHDGRHYQVRDVSLLPASVQRPRPPVWIGGFWPAPPADAPSRPVGRRRPAVRRRPGTDTSRRSTRSATWSPTSAGSATAIRRPFEIVLGGPVRATGRRTRPDRAVDRGGRHLVGRATAD